MHADGSHVVTLLASASSMRILRLDSKGHVLSSLNITLTSLQPPVMHTWQWWFSSTVLLVSRDSQAVCWWYWIDSANGLVAYTQAWDKVEDFPLV